MSDDVFTIATPFGDVAELGQGYVNRADGERILLPLPDAIEAGEGVRFIVHLADGTPAFAGAGRCVQSSDQGATVAASERFETLLDNLAFDDRSRPVYEYIVAVRQAVYAAGGPDAQAQVEGEGGGEGAGATEVDPTEEPTEFVDSAALHAGAASDAEEVMVAEASEPPAAAADGGEPEEGDPGAAGAAGNASDAVDGFDVDGAAEEPRAAAYEEPLAEVAIDSSVRMSDEAIDVDEAQVNLSAMSQPAPAAPVAPASVPVAMPSSIPAPQYAPVETVALPTGMLKRPALAAHWQPAAPRPPRPSKGTGMFRYAAGALPVPAMPPRPELDASLWVRPAASPNS